jgi:hypothetical protein
VPVRAAFLNSVFPFTVSDHGKLAAAAARESSVTIVGEILYRYRPLVSENTRKVLRRERNDMTRTGRLLAIAGTAGLTALALTAGPTAASAAPSGARHCTLDTSSGAQSCFSSFTDAIRHASQGRVTDAPADLRAATTDPRLLGELAAEATDTSVRAAGDVIQGTFFDGTDYRGNSLTITGTQLCKRTAGSTSSTTSETTGRTRSPPCSPGVTAGCGCTRGPISPETATAPSRRIPRTSGPIWTTGRSPSASADPPEHSKEEAP